MENEEFHIARFPANEHWPNGGWSVYRITGEQIARRYVFDAVNEGAVLEAHSWSGFVGCFASLANVFDAISPPQI